MPRLTIANCSTAASCLAAAWLFAVAAMLSADTAPPDDEESQGDAAAQVELPFMAVDREAGHIDLEATIVQQDAQWLELIACSVGSREHESIVTVAAKPSHIHLALLMLELEPGSPFRAERQPPSEPGKPAQFQIHPPRGPKVQLFFVQDKDGQEVETPANEWVINQQTGETMQGNVWLFTGSRIHRFEDQQLYLADLNGNIASLVNFGDDLLARDTHLTDRTDDQLWSTHSKRIPPLGTKLTLRLRPLVKDKPTETAAEPPESDEGAQTQAGPENGVDTPAPTSDNPSVPITQ